jgi:hypothetical protein
MVFEWWIFGGELELSPILAGLKSLKEILTDVGCQRSD